MMLVSNMFNGSAGGGSSSGNNKGTLTIQLPKTNYLFGETFSLTGAHIIYTPKRGDPVDVTNEVISNGNITPGDNYVWDVSGDQTIRAVYVNSNGDEVYGTLVVKVAEEGKGYLTVTTSKDTYVNGDQFNTSVLTIVYTDANGTETTIPASSVFITVSPENGSNFDIDGPNTITVAYDRASETGSQTANNPLPGYVNVTVLPGLASMTLKLKEISCRVGAITNYHGAKLVVTKTDGSRKEIIYGEEPEEDEKITWDPHERVSLDEEGDVTVTATYTEDGYSVSASSYIKVTKGKVKSITLTMSQTTFNAGENIDYNSYGTKVVAVYSDGSTRDVTQYTDLSPNGGTWQVSTTQVNAVYTENDVTVRSNVSVTVNDKAESLTANISKTSYEVGDSLTYAGSMCIVRYASGKEEQISDGAVSWSPAEGTVCSSEGSIFVTATYQGLTARTNVSVTAKKTTGTDANGNAIQTSTSDLNNPSSTTTKVIPSSIRIKKDSAGKELGPLADDDEPFTVGQTLTRREYEGTTVEVLDKDGELFREGDFERSSTIPARELEYPMTTVQITDPIDLSAGMTTAVSDGLDGVTGENMDEWMGSSVKAVSIPAHTPIHGTNDNTYYEYDTAGIIFNTYSTNKYRHVFMANDGPKTTPVKRRQVSGSNALSALENTSWDTMSDNYYFCRGQGKGCYIDVSASPGFHSIDDPANVPTLKLAEFGSNADANDRGVLSALFKDLPGSYRYMAVDDTCFKAASMNHVGDPNTSNSGTGYYQVVTSVPARILYYCKADEEDRVVTKMIIVAKTPFTYRIISPSTNADYTGRQYSNVSFGSTNNADTANCKKWLYDAPEDQHYYVVVHDFSKSTYRGSDASYYPKLPENIPTNCIIKDSTLQSDMGTNQSWLRYFAIYFAYGPNAIPKDYTPPVSQDLVDDIVEIRAPVKWNKYDKEYSTDVGIRVKLTGENTFFVRTTIQSAYENKLAQLRGTTGVAILSHGPITVNGETVYEIRYTRSFANA